MEKFVNKLLCGDSNEILASMPEDSVDLLVTDPPFGLNFMCRKWDKEVPAVEIWEKVLRVLKPGAFGFVMSSTRQDCLHKMIGNLAEAGFNTNFSSIYWAYKQGFTSSQSVEINLKRRGADEEVIEDFKGAHIGINLKPSVDVILIVQKPIDEKTQLDQALSNGKSVTWLDDCRIGNELVESSGRGSRTGNVYNWSVTGNTKRKYSSRIGRFPSNLLSDGDILGEHSKYFNLDLWPFLKLFDNYPFLFVPKANANNTDEGLESDRGGHVTVKPIKLFAYLITLASRPGDIILDPFAGMGTAAIAAKQLERKWICIEIDEDIALKAKERIKKFDYLWDPILEEYVEN